MSENATVRTLDCIVKTRVLKRMSMVNTTHISLTLFQYYCKCTNLIVKFDTFLKNVAKCQCRRLNDILTLQQYSRLMSEAIIRSDFTLRIIIKSFIKQRTLTYILSTAVLLHSLEDDALLNRSMYKT